MAILTRFAGAWGVPYFTFTSERGSECTNNFTGYVCTPITLAEVEFYADLDLPDDTEVVSGTYRSTHDYQLEALLEVPGRLGRRGPEEPERGLRPAASPASPHR